MESKARPRVPSHRRAILLTSLALAVTFGGYTVVYTTTPGTVAYWYAVTIFWALPLCGYSVPDHSLQVQWSRTHGLVVHRPGLSLHVQRRGRLGDP
jgi:hypothetical protein